MILSAGRLIQVAKSGRPTGSLIFLSLPLSSWFVLLMVCLIDLVYLVYLVCLVGLIILERGTSYSPTVKRKIRVSRKIMILLRCNFGLFLNKPLLYV